MREATMSVPQPVSRLSHWLALFGAAVRELGESCRPSFLESRQIDAPSTALDSRVPVGAPAPEFTLPCVGGGECSLNDFRGRRVLLAFVGAGRHYSDDLAQHLNRLSHSGTLQVLAIVHAPPCKAALWADEALASYPVLVDSTGKVASTISSPSSMLVVDEGGRIADLQIHGRQRSGSLIRRLIRRRKVPVLVR
jgi:peroxiredoxin